MELRICVLDEDLEPPARAFDDDSGLDLRARVDVTLSSADGPVSVPTGIAVSIPQDHVGLVCPRSGLAARDGISVLNAPGIVDPGYHGEIVVVLFSIRARPATIKRGDRIAQLLVVPAPRPTLVLVDSLPSTERGASGFGSTGR